MSAQLRFFLLLILTSFVFLLNACAYSIMDDKRLLDTMSSDKAMATSIKTALVENNFTKSFSVAVYCYYGHVFLVGEVPESFQEKALEVAKSRYPNSVTPHWFTPSKAADSDFVLSGRLRMALIGTKELSSTRVDTEVNAGRVVLLGVVGTEAERKKAIRTARKLDGVVNVTSYLMLPPIAGEGKHAPKGQNFAGENPKNAPKPKPKEVKFEEKKI